MKKVFPDFHIFPFVIQNVSLWVLVCFGLGSSSDWKLLMLMKMGLLTPHSISLGWGSMLALMVSLESHQVELNIEACVTDGGGHCRRAAGAPPAQLPTSSLGLDTQLTLKPVVV